MNLPIVLISKSCEFGTEWENADSHLVNSSNFCCGKFFTPSSSFTIFSTTSNTDDRCGSYDFVDLKNLDKKIISIVIGKYIK